MVISTLKLPVDAAKVIPSCGLERFFDRALTHAQAASLAKASNGVEPAAKALFEPLTEIPVRASIKSDEQLEIFAACKCVRECVLSASFGHRSCARSNRQFLNDAGAT